MPFTDVRLAIDTAGTVNTVKIPQTNNSLRELFNAGYVESTLGRTAWLSLVPGSALQANCNEEGFNIDHDSYAQARIGIIGNKTGCGPVFDADGNQVGDVLIQSFGYLFVR